MILYCRFAMYSLDEHRNYVTITNNAHLDPAPVNYENQNARMDAAPPPGGQKLKAVPTLQPQHQHLPPAPHINKGGSRGGRSLQQHNQRGSRQVNGRGRDSSRGYSGRPPVQNAPMRDDARPHVPPQIQQAGRNPAGRGPRPMPANTARGRAVNLPNDQKDARKYA